MLFYALFSIIVNVRVCRISIKLYLLKNNSSYAVLLAHYVCLDTQVDIDTRCFLFKSGSQSWQLARKTNVCDNIVLTNQ